MYAPCCLSSLARLGSTIDRRVVTFFALSRGTRAPQLLHEMKPDRPFPPFDRPLLFLFLDIIGRKDELPLRVSYSQQPQSRVSGLEPGDFRAECELFTTIGRPQCLGES